MKKQVLSILALATLTAASVSCKDASKTEHANNTEVAAAVASTTSNIYTANVAASSLKWKGFKPTGSHSGTINLKSGTLAFNGTSIASGSFVVDMNSIVVTDIPAEEEANGQLLGHLKSKDFFNVAAHNTATFNITGSSAEGGKTILSGNLTIKGIKQNISFPVNVSSSNNTMTLTSDAFTIDRTKWDIKYKSKTVFGDLGDKFINDDIELQFTVKASK